MSVDATAPALEVSDLELVVPRPRDRPARPPRRVLLDRARAVVRARGRVRMREVDGRARDRPLSPAQRSHLRRSSLRRRPRRSRARRARPPRVPRAHRLDGLPEPRRRPEPEPPRRRAGRGGVHRARRPGKEAADRALEALAKVQIADPVERDEPLPPPALRRHAAARRHRDGAREEPRAPDPRRADDRASTRRSRPRCSTSSRSSSRSSTPPCSSSATTSA